MQAKWLLGIAGLLLSTPGAVAQEVWGEAGVEFGYYSDPDFDYSETYADIWGNALFRFTNGFNVTVGGFIGREFEHDVTYGGVNSDIYFANSAYAAGIYMGVFTDSDDYENYFAGGQAAVFFATADVGAWAGWESNDGDDNLNAGTWFSYYIMPDTSVGAELFWEGNDEFDSYGVELNGEHRFTGTQWSVWADVSYRQFDGFGVEFDSWNTNAGVTLFFDPPGTTLQDHNHVMPF